MPTITTAKETAFAGHVSHRVRQARPAARGGICGLGRNNGKSMDLRRGARKGGGCAEEFMGTGRGGGEGGCVRCSCVLPLPTRALSPLSICERENRDECACVLGVGKVKNNNSSSSSSSNHSSKWAPKSGYAETMQGRSACSTDRHTCPPAPRSVRQRVLCRILWWWWLILTRVRGSWTGGRSSYASAGSC